MKLNHLRKLILLLSIIIPFSFSIQAQNTDYNDFTTTKPFTRWWWFASETDTNDIQYQLDWLKANEFGGVEIAWVYPVGGDSLAKRHKWLSREWTHSVTFAKQYANSIGLACDFTFGTLWPFGDSQVTAEDGTIHYPDTLSQKSMRLTWEHPAKGRIINHLDKEALAHYSQRMISGLRPALMGDHSALFCDSWEVDTRHLWTPGFDTEFERLFGYDIKPYMDSLYLPGFERIYYDYMKVLSNTALYNFYGPFTAMAHRYGAFTRVQCGGAPVDLLTAFSMVDIPETEALLFEPTFARIPASAAILSSKPLISSETFTCLYGWKFWPGPGPHQKEEQIADMKLVADALFSNGVNMIVWHGMPYNPPDGNNEFFAPVHVGRDASFVAELPPFNKYLEKVSGIMRAGKAYSSMAVYLPLEDSWMGVEYSDSLQFPWAWGKYELRYINPPEEIRGFQPIWINQNFLLAMQQDEDDTYTCGDAKVTSLYIDVEYMEFESLRWIMMLAQNGLPVCLKRDPTEPGTLLSPQYLQALSALKSLPNVSSSLTEVINEPALIEGEEIPPFWCRKTSDAIYIFFANPKTEGISYPLEYGQSFSNDTLQRNITINYLGFSLNTTLTFEPYQSLLIKVNNLGEMEPVSIGFTPSPPARQDR